MDIEVSFYKSWGKKLFASRLKNYAAGRQYPFNDNNFNKDFIDTFDKISTLYDNVLILGDINYDMLWT
jgi:hypothetical protein